MSDEFYEPGSDEEREAAEERIRRIRGGDSGTSQQPEPIERGDSLDDVVQSRAHPSKAAERWEDERFRRQERVERRRALNLVWVLLGLVGVVAILLALVWLWINPAAGFSLPFMATATPTYTPTPTVTPTPTLTPTPSATPTPEIPFLPLPPLTCAFQAGTSCATYCADAANTEECTQARDFVTAEDADAEYWLSCVDEAGKDPQTCMEEAWLQANPQ